MVAKECYWIIAAVMAVAVIGGWLLFGDANKPVDDDAHHEASIIDGSASISKNSRAARSLDFSGDGGEIHWSKGAILDSKAVLNLEFEKAVLRGGKISYARAVRMLKGEDFKNYMQDALWQSQRDMEAARVTEIYAKTIEKSFENDPSIVIENLGCGLSVCVGAITTYGAVGEDKYNRFQQVLSPADGTPAYSMIEVPMGEEGEAVEHRFVFATDPNMNAIADAARP
ncbi:hypothetical protein [Xanthomonas sp. 1678]|uniref:hypothetical protein n=1 Tax=Xanthomonas sp. 1678 TaxID=3158788 RepID=UPI002864E02F|nr:hypothetical protein [Xanthomonas translucens]